MVLFNPNLFNFNLFNTIRKVIGGHVKRYPKKGREFKSVLVMIGKVTIPMNNEISMRSSIDNPVTKTVNCIGNLTNSFKNKKILEGIVYSSFNNIYSMEGKSLHKFRKELDGKAIKSMELLLTLIEDD